MSTSNVANSRSLLFAMTVFTSAFLLFQVQPLLGKFILPWFGGSPAVWTMCMLVFQILLFGGYAYAHWLSGIGRATTQALIHTALLAVAVAMLPITPDASWKPAGDEIPSLRIGMLLLSTVGAPYFLLSATGPLLQQWFSRACPGKSPYRLYALSNTGSLLALLSYPFVVEPALSSTAQSWFWSLGFVVFAFSCVVCGWFAAQAQPIHAELSVSGGEEKRPDGITRLRWFVLAMLPSVMLLATTNEVCMDIAVVPFLWIIPLTLYLLSFILTFESDRFYRRKLVVALTAFSLASTSVMMATGGTFSVLIQIVVFFGNLFAVCMMCHGELVSLKPSARHLTSFYMTMSAGGAAGGLFVGLCAPVLFNSYCELPWGTFCCILIAVGAWLRCDAGFSKAVPASVSLKAGITFGAILLAFFSFFDATSESTQVATRNFYGVLRIDESSDAVTNRPMREMIHGRVVHGRQMLDESGRTEATTYYTSSSGIGRLLQLPSIEPRRIGVVGLGAGTLAVYGRPGDTMKFYEINPDVIRLAHQHFTFLSDSESHVEVLPGDARLVLEREEPQQLDVLVLDAFSGDAIPVHLLTAEAMEIYRRHLKSDGVLAFHISNTYFNLEPVVRAQAMEMGMSCRRWATEATTDPGIGCESVWMLATRNEAALNAALGPETETLSSKLVFWTDDRNNLLNVLR